MGMKNDWIPAVVDMLELVNEVFGAEATISAGEDKQLVVRVAYNGIPRSITIVNPDLCHTIDQQLAFFKTAKSILEQMHAPETVLKSPSASR
jgi:hypothetical protein